MIGLLEIFYSPGKVFDRVRERGTWVAPFFAVMLLACLSSAVLINLVGMETIARKQIEANPRRAEQLGPDGVERQIQAMNGPVGKTIGYAAPPLVVGIMLLALSGILMGAISLSGGTVRYPQILGTTSYTWFPFSVLGLLMVTLILNLSTNRADLDFQNLIALNPGAFLDKQTTPKALYSLATSLDLMSLGEIALLSYGLSKVARLSVGKCLGIILVLWAVWILGKAGLASIF